MRLAVCLLLPLLACGAEPTPTPTPTPPPVRRLLVEVKHPPSYARVEAAGALVRLGPGAPVAADAQGQVTFENLGAGPQALTATLALSAAQALELTGHEKAVELTATGEFEAGEGDTRATLQLDGPILGGWVIKELSYTGAPGVNGNHTFDDQFLELYNNSTHTLFADGLYVGDLYGVSGEINGGEKPTPFQAMPENVYCNNVWKVPGAGKDYPVPPGKSLVLAQDGRNHQPASTVDLSGADFETYVPRTDMRDTDFPTVPNLGLVHFTGGVDWLITVFGPGVVLFRVPPGTPFVTVRSPDGLRQDLVQVSSSLVLDAVEALMDKDSGRFKRVPAPLDASFVYATGTYTGESFRRKTAATLPSGRRVLRDTNSSASDFERLTRPTPFGF